MKPLLALLLLAACSKEPAPAPAKSPTPAAPVATPAGDADAAALHATCCRQCGAAARRDQAAVSLEGVACAKYAGTWNDQPGLDEACTKHFAAEPATVGDCWREQPDLK